MTATEHCNGQLPAAHGQQQDYPHKIQKSQKIKVFSLPLSGSFRYRNNMDWSLERKLRRNGFRAICGVDEVGRGPLAGPVTVAAVILPMEFDIQGLKDSKALSAAAREAWDVRIRKKAIAWAIVSKSSAEIDRVNILRATKRAMREAVLKLSVKPDFILLDAVNIDLPGIAQMGIIKGDTLSPLIAAASIIAKVHRDRLMREMDKRYPGYGFSANVGYGTEIHRDALSKIGITPIHRRSFLTRIMLNMP